MRPIKKKIKSDYDRLSAIEVYKLVLSGKLKKFPNRTWNQPDSVDYGASILRYLIEDILKWTDDDIRNSYSYKTLRDNRLWGLLTEVFERSPFKALNTAYPGRFKE